MLKGVLENGQLAMAAWIAAWIFSLVLEYFYIKATHGVFPRLCAV